MKAVRGAGIGRRSGRSKNECNPRRPGKSAGGSEKRCNGRQGNSCPAVTNRIVDLRRIRASICPLSRAVNASLRLRIPGQNVFARTQDPKSGEREYLTEAQVERHDIAAPTLSSRLGLGRSKEAKNAWKRRVCTATPAGLRCSMDTAPPQRGCLGPQSLGVATRLAKT